MMTYDAYVRENKIGTSNYTLKFYQGDTSHKTAGNGLGLSLTKRIVDLHGGKIEASSQVGVGTTFVITLSALPAS